jgi:hypothetical protein
MEAATADLAEKLSIHAEEKNMNRTGIVGG